MGELRWGAERLQVGWARFALLLVLALLLSACAGLETPESAAAPPTGDVLEDASGPFADAAAVGYLEPELPARVEVLPVWQPGAPERYVVREGDTLWGIAQMFLRDPWQWPEIWVVNTQIRNPHRIYPGDILSIHVVEGTSKVMVDGGPRVNDTVYLSPQLRVEPLDAGDDLINTLQPFMFRPRVVDAALLDVAPHIVAAQDERVLFGSRDQVYIRNAEDAEVFDLYHVIRRDRELFDPETGESLGIAVIPIGEAEILRSGNIATAVLRTTEREAARGDRLVGFDLDQDLLFGISQPPEGLAGTVIMLFDAISQVGRFQSLVLNRGLRDGVQKGQVFKVWQSGRLVQDPTSFELNDWVELPTEEIGTVMVFRTFEKVSYALVIESIRPIREGFRVARP